MSMLRQSVMPQGAPNLVLPPQPTTDNLDTAAGSGATVGQWQVGGAEHAGRAVTNFREHERSRDGRDRISEAQTDSATECHWSSLLTTAIRPDVSRRKGGGLTIRTGDRPNFLGQVREMP